MYTTSAPILLKSLRADTREIYLKQLKDARIDRLFITLTDFCIGEDEERERIASLRENLDFFSQNGLEVGVWVGTTLGHGVLLAGTDKKPFFSDEFRMVNLAGEALPDTRCPLYPDVREKLAHQVAIVAKSGAKTILLDDDFRMSHGAEPCCACEMHLDRIESICHERLTREQIQKLVFKSPANRYRAAWIQAQEEGLFQFARDIRKEVDAVDTSIRIGLCSCPALWGDDCSDAYALVRILAGSNKPLFRLFDAPYVAEYTRSRRLPTIFERARMVVSFLRDQDVEIMAEGDVYPRPRYHIPSSHLELFDALIRADGQYSGILKYMFDYASSPTYELGYLERHNEDLPLLCEMTRLFANKTACGVRTYELPNLFLSADLTGSGSARYLTYPFAASMLAAASIPTTRTGKGICGAVFGDLAKTIDLSELENGAILDATSAMHLQARGVDVGLLETDAFQDGTIDYMLNADQSERAYVMNGTARYLRCTRHASAQTVAYCEMDGKCLPYAYRYENTDGQRFLVYLIDTFANPKSGVERGYLQQSLLYRHTEWIARKPLPAISLGNPDLYLLAKKGEDGRLSVGLFNCYADSVLHPVVTLDRAYSHIKFLNTNGRIEGNRVYLDQPLHAFAFAAFEVFDDPNGSV